MNYNNRIIVIDTSGSMGRYFVEGNNDFSQNTKFQSAIKFLTTIIQNNDYLIVLSFSSEAKEIYKGTNKNELEKIIKYLEPTGGATKLDSALKLIRNNYKGFQDISSIDVITDGEFNIEEIINDLEEIYSYFNCFINFYLVGNMKINEQLIKTKIKKSNTFYILNNNDFETLSKDISKIEQDIVNNNRDNALAAYSNEKKEYKKIIKPFITAHFTREVNCEKWYSGEIFLFLEEFREIINKRLNDLIKQEGIEYQETTTKSLNNILEKSPIKILFESSDFILSQKSIDFIWYEPINQFQVRFKAIENKIFGIIDLNIFSDDLLISYSRITIGIGKGSIQKTEINIPIISEVFASYSRQDIDIVKHFKSRYKALGIYMFIDLEDIRAGSNWENDLIERIMKSDVLQLFWSNNSKKSKYVKFEYEKGLDLILSNLKGYNFIRPIFWEKPIPKIPENLSHINFYFLKEEVEENIKIEQDIFFTQNEKIISDNTLNLQETSLESLNFEINIDKHILKLKLSDGEEITLTNQLIDFVNKNNEELSEIQLNTIGKLLFVFLLNQSRWAEDTSYMKIYIEKQLLVHFEQINVELTKKQLIIGIEELKSLVNYNDTPVENTITGHTMFENAIKSWGLTY